MTKYIFFYLFVWWRSVATLNYLTKLSYLGYLAS